MEEEISPIHLIGQNNKAERSALESEEHLMTHRYEKRRGLFPCGLEHLCGNNIQQIKEGVRIISSYFKTPFEIV